MAVQDLSRSIPSALEGGATALESFEAPIGATGDVLKVTVDPGVGTLSQASAAQMTVSDWQILLSGLVDAVAGPF